MRVPTKPRSRVVGLAFRKFDEALNLDPEVRRQAIACYREATEFLIGRGLVSEGFLQGSFARKTMLKPLKDVDLIVVLSTSTAATVDGSANSPRAALEVIADALGEWRADARIEIKPKAVNVKFPDREFSLDVVPALLGENGDPYIANADEGRWQQSKVRRLNALVKTRNQECSKRWVHQVRMLKSLKLTNRAFRDLPGLVFESIAYRVITQTMSDDVAIEVFLREASTAVLGVIYEPTGEDDLTREWDDATRENLANAFGNLHERARQARILDQAGDSRGAHEEWYRLFGEPFPRPAPRSDAELAGLIARGSVTDSGVVSGTSAGKHALRPARAWTSWPQPGR